MSSSCKKKMLSLFVSKPNASLPVTDLLLLAESKIPPLLLFLFFDIITSSAASPILTISSPEDPIPPISLNRNRHQHLPRSPILPLPITSQNKGFSNSDFPRLYFLCPQIFSSSTTTLHLETLFSFLASDVSASPDQSRFLIYKCPELLRRSVEFRLRPTVEFLQYQIGVKNLSSPTTINAHLMNTPIEKLVDKVDFLKDLGLSFEESALVCRRFPAIFGYSLEFNLRPKVELLVEEVVKFPQYFAFSLERRILPRHLHLKRRMKTRVPLPKILMYSDQKFSEIWK